VKKIFNIAKYLLFIGIGIFIFWKVYKDQPIDELIDSASQVNYWWVAFALVIGVFSHIIRALRWDIALQSNNLKARKDNLFYSVMVGYLANYAFPRMGEISRAAVLKKYNNIPFTTSFGTIVTERLVDLIILLLFTLTVLIFQKDVISTFLLENPSISENVNKMISLENILIFSAIAIMSLLVYLFLITRKTQNNLLEKVLKKLSELKIAILSIFKLKRPLLYIFYSILIWVLYYLGLYLALPGFSFYHELNLGHLAVFTVFVMGSYGMVAPIQGGLGAYHFMIISTLVIYGTDSVDARLFALIVHGTQTILIIILGFFSLIAMSTVNKKNNTNGQ